MDIRPGPADESQPQDFAAALRKEAYSSVLRMLSEQGVRQQLLVYRGLPVTHLPEKMPNKEQHKPSGSECKSPGVYTLFKSACLFLRVEIPLQGTRLSIQNCLSNLV